MKEHYVAAIDQDRVPRASVFDRSARRVDLAEGAPPALSAGRVEHDRMRSAQRGRAGRARQGQLDRSASWRWASPTSARRRCGERTPAGRHHAINWADTRTDHLVRELGGDIGQDRFRERCGLPPATYFSGPKIRWLLDTVPPAGALRGRQVPGR
jgi:glycerol kinase